MEALFGNTTLVLSLLVVFVGLTQQIYKNYKEKKCGIGFTLIILALGVYLARIGYAVTINSIYILVPDVCGAIFTVVLVGQFFLYRKPAETQLEHTALKDSL